MNLFESKIDHKSLDGKVAIESLERNRFLGEISDLKDRLKRRVGEIDSASTDPDMYNKFYAALRLSTHVLGDPSRFGDDEIENIRKKLLKILS